MKTAMITRIALAVLVIFSTTSFVNGVVLFEDDFNDGDANGWEEYDGVFNVVSGVYQVESTGLYNDARSVAGDISWTDYVIDLEFNNQTTNRAACVLFRVQEIASGMDAGRYYQLHIRSTKVGFAEIDYSGGYATLLAEVPYTVSSQTWHHLRIRITGTLATAFIDGKYVLSYDGFGKYTWGKMGLKIINGGVVLYDNITVYEGQGPFASNPNPADGAVIPGDIYEDSIWTRLVFVPGATAVEHTGYFSDNYDDVAGRIEDANLGSPPYAAVPGWEYTFFAGNPQVPPATDSLVRGTRYYWCVDETDAQGITFPGNIWEFIVQNYKVCCPNPPDGAINVDPNVLLCWQSGFGAEEHDIYFGTSFDDVNDGNYEPMGMPPPWTHSADKICWDPVTDGGLTIELGMTYYWRVDVIIGRVPPFYIPTEFYKGDVWSFNTGTGGGLIAHWMFDEGSGSIAYDSAGTNDGTLVNGPIWTTGIIDGALDFDGVDNYVGIPDSLSMRNLDGSSAEYSISLWFNTTQPGASIWEQPTIFERRSPSRDEWTVSICLNADDAIGVIIMTPGIDSRLLDTLPVNDGSWHHVTATRKNTEYVKIFVDGNLRQEGSTMTDPSTTDLTTIGVRRTNLNIYRNYFDGKIDDVRIYDRALSATEVEELYNSVPVPPVGKTYHVDGVNGDNTNDGLTPETAFKTIQRGINVAEDFDTVLVWPGVYNEEISFWGDAITVKSAADAAIVETDYGYAFSFFSAEGHDTVLSNFVIRNSQYGIYLINGASPTLRNLTIVNNDFGISAFNGADPDINSCIFWNNYYGDLFRDPVPLEAKYSWVQDEVNEPIAHWKLDEGSGSVAYDSVGTNDGIIYGAAWTTGQVGGALDFDSVDDYVDLSDTVKNYLETSYTVSAWIKTNTIFSNNVVAAYRHNIDANPVLLQLDHFNEDIRLTVRDDAHNTAQAVYANVLTTNTWYHIAGLRKENNVDVYVNGISGIPGSETLGAINPDNLKIGALQFAGNPPSNHFDGTIDEVAIYNRALSAEEIEAIYEAGLSGLSYGEPGFVDAAGGDYHLLSERGRYWPAHDVWVLDDVTSPCIDGGDPAVDPSNERMPNGGRINMGAYGNTAYASMSEWPIKGDVNNDGRFNFMDIAILLEEWLEELPWAQ